jgi:hypothetical protein
MKSISTKVVLSALGISALLMTPALAKKAHTVSRDTGLYSAVSGYDKDGGVVGIPNPDEASK